MVVEDAVELILKDSLDQKLETLGQVQLLLAIGHLPGHRMPASHLSSLGHSVVRLIMF